ncbi:MAG: glycoside hydrolase family 38 N-terminal domain-containing protein [Armatimonadota bacterium]
MRIHLVPNSHIDPVWLWDKYEGIDEVINTFRSACDRLDEFPALTFTASSLQFYEWVLQYDPALFKRIQIQVAKRRWEVAGGWWVEADSNLPTTASFRKHAELSQAFAREHFSREITVAYLPDSFGHSATLPAILAETGFKYFIYCRPNIWEKPDFTAPLFWWEHDGQRILAYRLNQHYLGRYVDLPVTEDGPLGSPEYREHPVNCYFFGVGDHGGGPSMREINYYNAWIEQFGNGDAGYSSCERVFTEAESTPDIPVYRGDLHMHAVGCYSVVRDLKDAVRKNEHLLGFAGRALAMNGEPETKLDPLWKKVLFNQFHDILPGSCAPDAADQARQEMGGVEDAARTISYAALKSVAASRPVTAKEGEFRIFNTLPYPITRPLEIESFMYYREGAAFRDGDGREIAIQEIAPSVRCSNRRWAFIDTLPANGFNTYYFDNETIVSRPPASEVRYRPGDMITGDLSEVHACGTVLVGAGENRRPLLDYPARFLVLNDTSDTWGHAVRAFDDVIGSFTLDSVAILPGELASSLYQRWSYGHSRIEAVYTVYAGQSQVYLNLMVHWAEYRKILKLELQPQGFHLPVINMQGAGGVIRRPGDGAELPLHHWVSFDDWRGQVAVIQDGAFACDCENGRLRLTLVRSSIYGFHDPHGLNPDDPERLTDQGEHRFRLCLWTEPGLRADKIERFTAAFLEPCPVIREGYGTR